MFSSSSARFASAIILFLGGAVAAAQPVVVDPYTIRLYATGLGAVAGITLGPDGKLYAADNANGRVVRVEPGGSVTVLASGIPFPNGVAFTADGRLFVASGGGQAVYEVANGSARVFVGAGLSFPTSVTAVGNSLFVSNSGNGTISRIEMDGTSRVVLSGFSTPFGPYGLSADSCDRLRFIDHGTGGVYLWDQNRRLKLLGLVSAFGGTFTSTGFKNQLFVTDVVTGDLLVRDGSGAMTVFASGFIAKVTPPYIGPNGIAYDGHGALYVDDGDSIYVIERLRRR
jgi:sugar lactone lactonase YvrE